MPTDPTTENMPFNKQIFSLSVGHTPDCVDETVYTMSLLFSEACLKSNLSVEAAFESIKINEFEYYLTKILEEKICDCFKKK